METETTRAGFNRNIRTEPDKPLHAVRHNCDAAFSALHFSRNENAHNSRNANDSLSVSNQNSENCFLLLVRQVAKVQATDHGDRFLFHRSRGITDRQTLGEVLPEEGPDPAEALILRGVDQFMSNQSALAPAVTPHEDPVAQSEAAGCRSEKLNRGHGSFESEILGVGTLARASKRTRSGSHTPSDLASAKPCSESGTPSRKIRFSTAAAHLVARGKSLSNCESNNCRVMNGC